MPQFKNIVNNLAPLHEVRVKDRSKLWFNNDIQQAIYTRNYYHNKPLGIVILSPGIPTENHTIMLLI